MSAHTQITEWSKDQPPWRRDALRRLLTGAFGPADENQVLELLKAEHKLLVTTVKPEPLLAKHMPTPGASNDQLSVVSISNVANTNRLAPGQTLPFASKGLTLVYGDNGSGKSGYARILKKACRARMVETILHNVFDPHASQQPAKATFEITVGANASIKSVPWEDGKTTPTELARVAVFDSKCAAVYVDEENNITFIPYNLDCFERLARLSDRLKERLNTERDTLRTATATPVLILPESTTAAAFLNDLVKKTPEQIDVATAWTEGHVARIKELAAVVSDPEKRALRLRQLHAQVKSIRDTIANADHHLTEEKITALKKAKITLAQCQQAVALAASQAFNNEPLPGAGSSPWRALYEAARAYSEKDAYQDQTFPVIGDGARCVLCHQVLNEDGRDRMKRFDEFIRGEVTKQADAATTAWEHATKVFRDAVAPLAVLAPTLDDVLRLENVKIHEAIVGYLAKAIVLRQEIENAVINDGDEALSQKPPISVADVDAFLTGLATEAASTEEAAKDDQASKLRNELAELQARNQLHVHKDQVVKRCADLKTIKALDNAIKACGTTGISQKGTELLKQHVTGKFDSALAAERKALKIENIPLRLISRSPKGSPSHQIKLDQTSFSGDTSQILSEGEHRALALAAFLAEQTMVSGTAPIIIDDPVSSLDHERRHRVVDRIVEEAKKRQVIVFTHDLLFYTDATFVAAKEQVPITKVAIRLGPGGYGTIDPDGDPWNAKTLGKRRAWLEQQYAKLKKLHGGGQTEEYEKEARFFYDRLRETWERLIEEGLFANVIVRYRRSVESKRLSEAVVDDPLVLQVYQGMAAISEYTAHDKPAAAGGTLPDPDTMKGHLDALITCIGAVESESKIVKKRREKSEKPPTGLVSAPLKS